jgi:cell fate (sporulation/competence/biofilm development) regulator YmcA (YheA/YmcA/DUF963 family)
MEILVFKTNLINANRIQEVQSALDVHPQIIEWNVDLNDCDNVLRIVGNKITSTEIETLVLQSGYYCEELM